MSARSPQPDRNPDEGFTLVPALQQCLSPGVIVVGANSQILACSPELEICFDLAPGELTGASIANLPAAVSYTIRAASRSHGVAISGEFAVTGGAQLGRKFHLNAIATSSGPAESLVVLTMTDVTGFARLQQSVERLDRLATAGTLSAGMAHEIKNALVAVKTFVDLLLEKNKDAELAEIVSREMSRVNAIVRQLLKFGGATRPERGPVRLHDVLEHSLRMVQHQLDGKLISLNRAFKATSDIVPGDNQQLEQVFVNLFLNAVDATGANGSLTVETEFIASATPDIAAPQFAGQPHVRVMVADTGAGITPENLEQMFEPFFTTKNHGTGLGLPITRRIVHEHQGQILVESQPNKGTVFNIILPAAGPAI